jgi:hypothetical protein
MLHTAAQQLFLLSPAYCGGKRATYLLHEGSTLPLAMRLAEGTLTLGEAFTFVSGLYFRGKLGYARAFGRHNPPALVITPTRGLLPPETLVTAAMLREFAAVDVDADDRRYRKPLDRSLRELMRTLDAQTRVVLLGSIATGKYVDALTRAFGERVHFPAAFVGRGDMSRGGLMLRCIASSTELEYSPLVGATQRHGARPPKLEPLPRIPAARAAIPLVES